MTGCVYTCIWSLCGMQIEDGKYEHDTTDDAPLFLVRLTVALALLITMIKRM